MNRHREAAFIDWVYPSACALCRKACLPIAGYPGLCRRCLARLPLLSWPDCFQAWPDDHQPIDFSREWILSSALDQTPLNQAVRRFRDRDHPELASVLAPLLGQKMLQAKLKDPALVAMPCLTSRQKNLGYRPAESLVQQLLCRINGSDASCLLEKVKETKPQHLCQGYWQRRANVSGAFRSTHEGLRIAEVRPGQTLFLVDILTVTGATLNEAAHVLRKRGFKVCALTVARAS